MLNVNAGFSLLEKCKPLNPTKKTAIILPGAILKSEFFLFYFNRAFKVKKSDGIKADQNSKKCIYTSGCSRPRQQFGYLTLWLCVVTGPSKNWVEAT